MKYPQLVSTRAVNAITDWLVSRLEHLGVEAPHIYSRLLLSLLQSSVQINDPIEFSNLETYFVNRKSGSGGGGGGGQGNHHHQHQHHNHHHHYYKRLLDCDTDTLKKLNAVQCLRDIVSSEQDIATVEELVDELFVKLRAIEKQSTDIDDDDNVLLATVTVGNVLISSSSASLSLDGEGIGSGGGVGCVAGVVAAGACGSSGETGGEVVDIVSIDNDQICSPPSAVTRGGPSQSISSVEHHHNNNSNNNNNNSFYSSGPIAVIGLQQNKHHNFTADDRSASTAVDLETDPKKRYFRAFPALSKEMEDSFRIWRQNAKSLTWPMVDRGGGISSISSSSSSSTLSTSFGSVVSSSGGGGGGAGDNALASKEDTNDFPTCNQNLKGGISGDGPDDAVISSASAGGIKKKTKRRRYQGLTKGKTFPNMRKNPATAVGVSAGGGGGGGGGGRHRHHSSPTYWDTEFEGCWEMGRDLIKEFIMKQNNRNRNRSRSESAASCQRSAVVALGDGGNDKKCGDVVVSSTTATAAATATKATEAASSPAFKPVVDISFCCDDDFDDSYAGLSEINAAAGDKPVKARRRLYQRAQVEVEVDDDADGDHHSASNNKINDDGNADNNQSADEIAQFTAKFNSSVEALWNDVKTQPDEETPAAISSSATAWPIYSSLQMPTLPAVAAFKDDLENFWSNYYSHHYDLNQLAQPSQSSLIGSAWKMDDGCGSGGGGGGGGGVDSSGSLSLSYLTSRSTLFGDLGPKGDFYSMPGNLTDFDKSVGGLRRAAGEEGSDAIDGNIGVFLQKSIWSDQTRAAVDMAGLADGGFYMKSCNAAKRLNPVDALRREKIISGSGGGECDSSEVFDNWFSFSPYNVSKWSEGINAGPPPAQHQQQKPKMHPQVGTIIQSECIGGSVKNNNNINSHGLHIITGIGGGGGGNGIDYPDSSAPTSMSTTSCSSSYTRTSSNAYNSSWQTPVAGQNLQADEKSWSASNPLTLTELYNSRAMANSARAGADTVDGDLVTRKHYTPATATASDNGADDDEDSEVSAITLANHCSKSSGFVEYKRLKPLLMGGRLNSELKYAPGVTTTTFDDQYYSEVVADGENLLTSERTHFNPIKTYIDGFSFNIAGYWDDVHYEQSPSGFLYYESERYLEYTRNDVLTMINDDDIAGVGLASATPLYANSNCEAATEARAEKERCGVGGGGGGGGVGGQQKTKTNQEFKLRFRVIGCEMACQTDDNIELWTSSDYGSLVDVNSGGPVKVIYANARSGGIGRCETVFDSFGGNFMSEEAMKTLSQAIAAAAQVVAANSQQWLPTLKLDGSNYRQSLAAWTTAQTGSSGSQQPLEEMFDEIDFCAHPDGRSGEDTCSVDSDSFDSEQQQWSMREIGKRCQQMGHNLMSRSRGNIGDRGRGDCNSNNNNNNNNNSMGGNRDDARNMWSLCAACNNEFKSVPANRLLRDELRVEADEIMNDLKYMQDLYIGQPESETDEETAMAGRGDDNGNERDDEERQRQTAAATVASVGTIGDASGMRRRQRAEDMETMMCVRGNEDGGVDGAIDGGWYRSPFCHQQKDMHQQTEEVYQQVNRLIADLLNPGSGKGEGAEAAKIELQGPASAEIDQPFSGSLWANGRNEQDIWRGSEAADGQSGDGSGFKPLKPIDWLRQWNVVEPTAEPPSRVPDNGGNISNDRLTWDHENLAELWRNESQQQQLQPPPGPGIEILRSVRAEDEEERDDREYANKIVVDKNRKNLQASLFSHDPAIIAVSSCGEPLTTVVAPADSTSAAAAYKRVQQLLNCSSAAASATASATAKLKLTNRKRRHSASQNMFHHYSLANNNNVDIANLNNFNLKLDGMASSTAGAALPSLYFGCDGGDDDLDRDVDTKTFLALRQNFIKTRYINDEARTIESDGGGGGYETDDGGVAAGGHPNSQTIITCKYWTTVDPSLTTAAAAAADVIKMASADASAGAADDENECPEAAAAAFACLIDKNASILRHVTMVTRPLTR